MFSARGFNIDSLTVGVTNDADISRMTIVVRGDDRILEQVMKQLNKLINVIKVVDLSKTEHVEREMILIKVSAEPKHRPEILRIVDIFRGKVVDVGPKTYTIEVTGNEGKISAIIKMLAPVGILEIARTGKACLQRGSKSLRA